MTHHNLVTYFHICIPSFRAASVFPWNGIDWLPLHLDKLRELSLFKDLSPFAATCTCASLVDYLSAFSFFLWPPRYGRAFISDAIYMECISDKLPLMLHVLVVGLYHCFVWFNEWWIAFISTVGFFSCFHPFFVVFCHLIVLLHLWDSLNQFNSEQLAVIKAASENSYSCNSSSDVSFSQLSCNKLHFIFI